MIITIKHKKSSNRINQVYLHPGYLYALELYTYYELHNATMMSSYSCGSQISFFLRLGKIMNDNVCVYARRRGGNFLRVVGTQRCRCTSILVYPNPAIDMHHSTYERANEVKSPFQVGRVVYNFGCYSSTNGCCAVADAYQLQHGKTLIMLGKKICESRSIIMIELLFFPIKKEYSILYSLMCCSGHEQLCCDLLSTCL